jgi:hypothetical protein
MANVAADRLTAEMGNRRPRWRMNHSMFRDATWTETDCSHAICSGGLRRLPLGTAAGMSAAPNVQYEALNTEWCKERSEAWSGG